MKKASCNERITVGLLGTSIRGLVRHCIESAGLDARWNIVEVNIPDNMQKDIESGSFIAKIKKALFMVKAISNVDILCIVYVSSHSLLFAKLARVLKKRVIYYWLGSDVLSLMNGELKESVARGDGIVNLHLAYAENLVEELSFFGISAKTLVTPATLAESLAPMPSHHSVLLSIPDSRRVFYGYEYIIRLAREFPEVPFHVVRSTKPELYDLPNITFEGLLSPQEMERVYCKVSVVIRFPEHDGTSLVLMESMFKGKYLISRHKFPNAILAKTYEELAEALCQVLNRPLEPCLENHKYAQEHFTQQAAGERWAKLLEDLLVTP